MLHLLAQSVWEGNNIVEPESNMYYEAQIISPFQAAPYEGGRAKTMVDYKPGKGPHRVWDADFEFRPQA